MKNMRQDQKTNYLRRYFDGFLIAISIEFTIYLLKQMLYFIEL